MLDARLLSPEKPRDLKRVEYDRLVSSGALDDEHVELLRGTLVEMSPNDPAHSSPIQALTMILAPELRGRAVLRVQLPIIAVDESEPEPDLAVVPSGDYRAEHPAAVHLVIEVAVSSINKDRKIKAPLYAASGFREYWLVDVSDHSVEVYRQPGPEGYQSMTRHRAEATLALEAFPDIAVCVADIFQ